ncbi:MAG: tRNA lysidine(34) synthetase TilS [Porticoccaceae bacterium]|nr:tRNA lysidine(34) synthetase TilS [Porticoccaceae bacterium]
MSRSTATGDISASAVFADYRQELDAAPQILVGLSGGLDSTVLLSLLCEVIAPENITAVHINHGLSANADHWQQHSAEFCQSLGVRLHAESVAVNEVGGGLESAARDARYKVFEKLIIEEGILLLGHHADDQVETVLYRLLRGSGPKGLAAIPVTRPLGLGKLLRPLLSWPKASLQRWAAEKQLGWIEDESNQQEQFDRNYLRHRVVPALAERWPDYIQGITRSAQHSLEADQLAESVAWTDLEDMDVRPERAGLSLSLEHFNQLEPLRQRNLLRYWPSFYMLAPLSQNFVEEVINSLVSAREDSEPKVVRGNIQFCRYRDRLYLLNLSGRPKVADDACLYWHSDELLVLPDGTSLSAEPVRGEGLRIDDVSALTLRFRQGGERCQPAGRDRSNSLKKLLQEYALEPWWRERIPLFYIDEQLVAVGDLWVCQGWQCGADEEGLKITWETNSL